MIKIGLSTHNFFGEFYSLFKIMDEFCETNIKLISDIIPDEIKNLVEKILIQKFMEKRIQIPMLII